jgi:hypothetical protein
MESTAINDPKDEHILNKDDSVTNKDGDSYLEKGERPTDPNRPDNERLPTGRADNDNGESELPAEDKPSKKDGEAKKYAL